MHSIERLIEQAIQRGEFDDLPGQGRRLPDTGWGDDEWGVAAHLLRGQGYGLPWIERAREIDAELDQARSELRSRWAWYGEERDRRAGWQRSVQDFAGRIDRLNRMIRDYNLTVPLARFQRRLLDLEAEFNRLRAEGDQSGGDPTAAVDRPSGDPSAAGDQPDGDPSAAAPSASRSA